MRGRLLIDFLSHSRPGSRDGVRFVRFLPNGQAIRREVQRIFKAEKGRRVALVAFVGKSAEAYLPRPKGLELVCWPHAPGTNPATVKLLINKKKVNVRFSRRLHMKVYWTQSHGAVVASSNLSTNAYGSGALHEAGVLLPSFAVRIDALLASVKPEKVTPAALKKLKREWLATKGKLPPGPPRQTFGDWLAAGKRPRWLLHCFDVVVAESIASKHMRAVAKEETGSSKVVDSLYCRRGEIIPEEAFVLTVDVGSRRVPVIDTWFFPHRVVLVARGDKKYDSRWPYQAGQLYSDRACPSKPFAIEGAFREALRASYKELGDKAEKEFSIERTARPSAKLLTLLEKHWRAAGRN